MGQSQQHNSWRSKDVFERAHPTPKATEKINIGATTAKSQVVAVCCAPIIAKRVCRHPCNSSDHEGAVASSSPPSSYPLKPSPAMVEWCQSLSLVRMWAEEWVLRPVRDAVFRLPLRDSTQIHTRDIRRFRYLCVSVSPTLGVVSVSAFTSTMLMQDCMTGPNKVLFSKTSPSDWVLWEHSVLDSESGAVCWSSPSLSFGYSARANRKWLACSGSKHGELCIWRVAGGIPEGPGVCFQTSLDLKDIDLSPESHDILMDLGWTCGAVTFVDLDASFQAQGLVVQTKIMHHEVTPKGVMWLSDGSMCTLHFGSSVYFLVDELQHRRLAFPKDHMVHPISKGRAFVISADSHRFRVYDTEGSDPTKPSFCVPCTWCCPSNQSGLIASTGLSTRGAKEKSLKVSLHDGLSTAILLPVTVSRSSQNPRRYTKGHKEEPRPAPQPRPPGLAMPHVLRADSIDVADRTAGRISFKAGSIKNAAVTARHRHVGRAVVVAPPPATTTTSSMRDQVGALAMGAHPRCGGGAAGSCALRRGAMSGGGGGGGYGMLVVRLVWEWLWCRSRFYCLKLFVGDKHPVLVTFGVSTALLSLTHEDVVTGQRTLLLGGEWSAFGCQVNGKWLVCRDKSLKNLAVVELPTRCAFGERFSPSAKKPTVVPLPLSDDCQIYLDNSCEDRMLFSFTVSGLNFHVRSLKLMLIDLAQTNSSKELVVLSVTEPQLELFPCGAHVFVDCVALSGNYPAFITIEEGTAHTKQAQVMPRVFPRRISPLSQTQFCLFGSHKDTYEVWDATDTTRPARTMKCLPGCTTNRAFVEGGLLFQMSESTKEMHVTEESSGDHVITLAFFKETAVVSNFCFLLS
ncbi:hypothetical protein Pelo_14445 [Pelomyxa schiedti]|nr:hypothetical protein Pelo_14445 [Pelomyxa schiedti]